MGKKETEMSKIDSVEPSVARMQTEPFDLNQVNAMS